jgi:hypothetical protein
MLFEKISGIPATRGPFPPSPSERGRPAASRLPAILTPALASGLHQSAAAFLAGQGIIGEPLTWEPPAGLLDELTMPGTDPATIDTGQLHQLIRRDRLSTATAARRLRTTRATVELLLDHDPAPAAGPTTAPEKPLRKVPSRDELAASLAANMSLTQIAKQAGMSPGYASQLARDYGIPVRGQGARGCDSPRRPDQALIGDAGRLARTERAGRRHTALYLIRSAPE